MRRAAVAMLTARNIDQFRPVQHAEATQLMWEMVENPEVLSVPQSSHYP
jgi:hypothetical protein